jgi:hypothetical protein
MTTIQNGNAWSLHESEIDDSRQGATVALSDVCDKSATAANFLFFMLKT